MIYFQCFKELHVIEQSFIDNEYYTFLVRYKAKMNFTTSCTFFDFFFETYLYKLFKNNCAIRICRSDLVSKLWLLEVSNFAFFLRMSATLRYPTFFFILEIH